MTQYLGVQPIPGTSTTAVHDTTGDRAPVLEIKHTYYQQAQEVEGETHFVLAGSVQVKNAGSPMLKEIYVLINLNFQHEDFSRPYVCDVNGNPIEPDGVVPALFFGDLPSDVSSPVLTYYWTVKSVFRDPVRDRKPFEVTPVLIPQFRVDYSVTEAFDADTTVVQPGS